jgi:multidrug efflux system membrane fusion protein
VLRSPLDGIVMTRSVEVGALAAPGTIAFAVADVGSVKAAFGVPDMVLPRVHLGAALAITTEAYPGDKFEGRISLIAPSADPRSRVFEVDVTIPNADGRLKPGSVAALSLEGGGDPATATAPLIPLSAIVRSPGHPAQFAVFTVDTTGGHAVVHARDVELGEYLGRVIPVKRGLTGGETVVVQGAGLLSDGESVEVIQ